MTKQNLSTLPSGIRITEEDRLLIARGAELSARADNTAAASSYLSPRQPRLQFESAVMEKRADQIFFWGGCMGATRRMAIYLPGWILSFAPGPDPAAQLFTTERETHYLQLLSAASICPSPSEAQTINDSLPEKLEDVQENDFLSSFVHPLLLEGSGFRALSHRDWLGSLMSLGIKREILGDITVWDDFHAVVFCQTKSTAYLISELKKAGRDAVRAVPCRLPEGFVPRQQYAPVTGTVASPRADGVIRTLCNISRDDAMAMIQRGLVELNYDPIEKTDVSVAAGDIISVRGYGKFKIDEIGRPTQRGRMHLAARKYQ